MKEVDNNTPSLITHAMMIELFNTYLKENVRFESGGIKASCPRARKALSQLYKMCVKRRKQLQRDKISMGTKPKVRL